MTTNAQCPLCLKWFLLDTSVVAFAAVVDRDPHGRPRVRAYSAVRCPDCRTPVRVPESRQRVTTG